MEGGGGSVEYRRETKIRSKWSSGERQLIVGGRGEGGGLESRSAGLE